MPVLWLPNGFGDIEEPLIIIGSKKMNDLAIYAITRQGQQAESFGNNQGFHIIANSISEA